MDTPATRPLTPARIVALALIGILVAVLAYVRIAPAAGAVSVPPRARRPAPGAG